MSKSLYPKIFLRREKEEGIRKKHHPWIFSHATDERSESGRAKARLTSPTKRDSFAEAEGSPKNGELVDVYLSDRKTFFGRGYYNQHSQIRVRFLTRDFNEAIDRDFFVRRFRELSEERRRFIDESVTNAYRLVFGESDSLPGLILDKYNDTYVFQIHTAGMEQLKSFVMEAMKEVFHPMTIYERSDIHVRLKEGLLDCPRQHIFGEKVEGEIEILENGARFYVDIINGQKTGFFLDQRENRKALQKYAKGRRVLNCFCYTGGFSVYAALAGALETTNLDVSAHALETAKRNFTLNDLSLDRHSFLDVDVFDFLSEANEKKLSYDLIILDPPAFVKNKKTLKNGLSGYLKINEMALRLLPKGGMLVSSSCSSHVTDELFRDMLTLASHRAQSPLKILEIRHQPPDHPYSLDFPEGKYLKFWVGMKG